MRVFWISGVVIALLVCLLVGIVVVSFRVSHDCEVRGGVSTKGGCLAPECFR